MILDQPTIDALKERGATDDMLLWLKHPEHVRFLIDREPSLDSYDQCSSCQGHYPHHTSRCAFTEAWFKLKHPRFDSLYEGDWDSALYQEDYNRRREKQLRADQYERDVLAALKANDLNKVIALAEAKRAEERAEAEK
jgi:hypothetical protein